MAGPVLRQPHPSSLHPSPSGALPLRADGAPRLGHPPYVTLKLSLVLDTAKADLLTAYNNAFAQTPDTGFVAGDNQLGGQTLTAPDNPTSDFGRGRRAVNRYAASPA